MTTINAEVVNIENLKVHYLNKKYCPICDFYKTHNEFGRNKCRKDGMQSYCKI